MGIIYKAINKINGHIYIGKTMKTLEERKLGHKANYKATGKRNYHFYNAIIKYGFDNFEWSILCETDLESKLNALEKFYIAGYRKTNTLYNHTNGGDGMSGYKHSAETKKKQSERMSGVNHPNYGKNLPRETRLKMSIASIGKLKTEEHRMNIGKSHKGIKPVSPFKKGNIPWNKGIKGCFNEEATNKMSESHLGQKGYWEGKKLSLEHRNTLSESHKGQIPWMKGRKHTELTKNKIRETKARNKNTFREAFR